MVVMCKKLNCCNFCHEYAKYRPVDENENIVIQEKMPKNLLEFHSELLHAPVGAYLVKKEVGIDDVDILNAITYHTTGRPNMRLLEKIVFISDYIEPNPNFPGVDEVRALVHKDLNAAIIQALKNTIIHLASKNAGIYPDTINTYNSFLIKKEA